MDLQAVFQDQLAQFHALEERYCGGQVDAEVFYLSVARLLEGQPPDRRAAAWHAICEGLPKGDRRRRVQQAVQRRSGLALPGGGPPPSSPVHPKPTPSRQRASPSKPATDPKASPWKPRQPPPPDPGPTPQPSPGPEPPQACPAPGPVPRPADPSLTPSLAAAQPKAGAPRAAKKGTARPAATALVLETLVVHFHHILNPEKREVLQTWAHELDLKGVSQTGTPGVVVIEGMTPAVTEYVARLRTLRWQTMELRGQERVIAKRRPPPPKSPAAPAPPAAASAAVPGPGPGGGGWGRGGGPGGLLSGPGAGLAFSLGARARPPPPRPLTAGDGPDPEDWQEVQSVDQLRRFTAAFREVARLKDLLRACDEAGVGEFVRECLERPRPALDPIEVIRQEADRTVERGLDPLLLKGATYSEKRVQRGKAQGLQDLLMQYELEKAPPD